MFFILHTVPIAFSKNSKLVRDSVALLPEQLDIQVMTGEYVWRARERWLGIFCRSLKEESNWMHVSDHPTSRHDSLQGYQHEFGMSS